MLQSTGCGRYDDKILAALGVRRERKVGRRQSGAGVQPFMDDGVEFLVAADPLQRCEIG